MIITLSILPGQASAAGAFLAPLRRWRWLPFLLLAVVLCSSCVPEKEKSVPDSTLFPKPPQQGVPWVALTNGIPPAVATACAEIFEAGLADPRGCEFREITLESWKHENREQQSKIIATRGWVLPAKSPTSPRFATCWNGLIYPVTSVGAAVDPVADISKLLNATGGPWSKDPSRPSLEECLAPDHLSVFTIPMLLRLGQGDLATQVWKRWNALPKSRDNDPPPPSDFFAILAREWLWAERERGFEAHLQGEASFAVAFLRDIPSQRALVEKIAKRRGIALSKFIPPYQRDDGLQLSFLDQIPALLADDQRRVMENRATGNEAHALEKIPDKKERIALLIHALEDVHAFSFMSPGYVQFEMDPVVDGLIKQGEEAVDPLIDCLEKDHRLTRTLDDGGGRHIYAYGYPRIIGVQEPALAALQEILQSRSKFGSLDEPYVNYGPAAPKLERRALAAQIRAYWRKVQGQTLPQRWYSTLQDDGATNEQWAEAASAIVAPQTTYSRGFHIYTTTEPKVIQGEDLRGVTNPSVADLLAKRLRDAAQRSKTDTSPFPGQPPKKLAEALTKWGNGGQLATLAWYCGVLQQTIAKQGENMGPGEIDELIKTYLARKEAGDPHALAEYAQWLQTADTRKLMNLGKMYCSFVFPPVWSYPDDPAIRPLIHWLFQDPKSPWSTGSNGIYPRWIAASAHSPLESIPAYRELVLQGLLNKEEVGSVEVTSTTITVQYTYGSGSLNNDPDAVVGTKQPIRFCDYLASRISAYQGAPRFETYWSESRRDSVIPETVAFLQRYGNQLGNRSSSQDEMFNFREDLPRFPTLDHPASADEAAAGRAIFSLEGKGDRRVFKLPAYPFRANWTTLKDRRTIQRGQKEDGTMTEEIVYPQEGLIWQAEEVLIDGKWQRTYGYAGCGHLAAVPADQIQFVPADGFDPMGDAWGFSVNLHGNDDFTWSRPIPQIKTGQPVPVTIGIKNLRGDERPLPLKAPTPGITTTRDADIKLTVSFTNHPYKETYSFPPNPRVTWEILAPKTPVELEVLPFPATLAPLEGKTYLRLDLAKWYDFTATGTYQVQWQFVNDSPFASKYGHLPMSFEVVPKS